MPEIKRPVVMCGENPGIRLFAAETEQLLAVASYWHCTYSPDGPGHALVLWLADHASTDPAVPSQGGIYTDNAPLARALVENLTQHFPEFRGLPVAQLPYIAAECGHVFDGARYAVTCRAEGTLIELVWQDLLDRKYLNWPQFPTGSTAHDLTTVICPCGAAHVTINGAAVPGEVHHAQTADGFMASTAFLAFAESWVGPV